MTRKYKDFILSGFIWLGALITVGVLLWIMGYIAWKGLPHVSLKFLTSPYSASKTGDKGILPMIINTLYIVLLSLCIAAPLGISSAIYLTQYAKQGKLVKGVRFATEILSGIPSVIFGLFGYAIFVKALGLKYSILSGTLTMVICILPILVRTTEEALLAVPKIYKEGALGLGSSTLKASLGIVLPCAVPGILTGIILAIGRIVGETAVLLFTVGVSGYSMPKGNNLLEKVFGHIFEQGSTLAIHLYMSATSGKDPISVTFATALVLMIFVFLLNRLMGLVVKRFILR